MSDWVAALEHHKMHAVLCKNFLEKYKHMQTKLLQVRQLQVIHFCSECKFSKLTLEEGTPKNYLYGRAGSGMLEPGNG